MQTPALVVERDALDANLAAMQRRCDDAGVALRPHVKGHKCAWVAARQLEHGAVGLAAATLDEAEGLLRAGLGRDVLLTSVVSPRAVGRIVALRALGDLAVVADDRLFVAALGDAAAAAGVTVRAHVDLDVGQRRGGAATAEAAVGVARAIDAADRLELAGVQAYEGHLQLLGAEEQAAGHRDALAALRAALDALGAAGLAPERVTAAGTGTAELALRAGLATEVQPGSYALMDATYAATPAGTAFRPAARVLATVRSRPQPGTAILDAGLKALSTDLGPAVCELPGATYAP
ncbi:MAG TPA: alanine racemase, partial [Capillimicrobium sp.]